MGKYFGVATKAIIKKADKYLVLFKSEIEDISPNEIDIPGGRLEFGEGAEEALKREVREETGLEVEILRPSQTWSLIKDDLHLFGVTFLAEYVSGEVELSNEHKSYRWIEIKEVLDSDYPLWIKKEFSKL